MRKHIFISGRVQGVGFRHFTKTNARKLGVKGWVKNLPDGRVEAIFEGEAGSVQNMIEKCRQGPPAGRVKEMEVKEEEETGGFISFEVRY